MDENITILIVTLLVLGYGYFSQLMLRFNISGPMVFMAVGVFISPLGIGVSHIHIDSALVQTIAELALVIVLFSDASQLKLKELRYEWGIPARLLIIGLPLTIVFSAYIAHLFFPQELITYVLVLALILAPTDAALGKAVVTDKTLPERIRSSINVESGLNDGIVYPILVTVVAIIVSGQNDTQGDGWIYNVLQAIIFGGIIGSIVGYISARLSTFAIRKKWMLMEYKNLIPLALAVLAYLLAEYFGGNGFIAAFFAGLLVGNYNQDLRQHIEDFSESEGDLLILISFLIFGLVFIPATIMYWDLKILIFSLLSLTLFRMLPVAISLIGSRLDMSTLLFIGWFGPRGIASILYTLTIFHEIGSVKDHADIYAAISLTVFLSIILHGISAQPLVSRYAKKHKEK
ncbi:MAG: sodium:proton exchanger [Sulfurovum sp.]|nr:MAG: sodium:proton exchanger [Sulfurovum sp.]